MIDSAKEFAIFTMDQNGIATSWNVGAERLVGYREGEIVGHTADVMFPPEDGGVAAAEEERRRALALGRAEDERWQLRKDGSRFWASGLLLPLADRTQGFVKILRDYTTQHELQERLRESEELFRSLATHIPQLVFRGTQSGHRTWASPQWCVFTGMSFHDSMGFGWLDAIHPDDREVSRRAWLEAISKGEYYAEHRIRRAADQEYRWHQTRAVRLPHSHTHSEEWVGTSTDIHDLRNLQDEQGVLLAELQHRTRNLLALVQGVARQTVRASESLDQFTAAFESRLRALSRVQKLLTRIGHESIPLQELVETELFAHGARDPDRRVMIEGPACVLPASSAQPLALAIHELATNATKYGALAHPDAKLRVSWITHEAPKPPRVILTWQETGVPMPQSTPARQGYGSELIEHALPYQLRAETRLEFGKDGVTCEISAPLETSCTS